MQFAGSNGHLRHSGHLCALYPAAFGNGGVFSGRNGPYLPAGGDGSYEKEAKLEADPKKSVAAAPVLMMTFLAQLEFSLLLEKLSYSTWHKLKSHKNSSKCPPAVAHNYCGFLPC